MEGNVARQFAQRWPLLWQEISEEIRYPIPLGNVFEFEVPDEDVVLPSVRLMPISTIPSQDALGAVFRLTRHMVQRHHIALLKGGPGLLHRLDLEKIAHLWCIQ